MLQKVNIIEDTEFWLMFYFLLCFTQEGPFSPPYTSLPRGPQKLWDPRAAGREFPGAGYTAPLCPGSVPLALGLLVTLQPDGL